MGTLGRRGQGDRPRRCRHNDRIRFGAASLTVVFELPLSDVTVVDGEKVVLECHVAVKPAAEVTGTSTRRSRCAVCAPAPGRRENGASQPLTLDHSFVQRTLYDKPSAPRGPLELSDVARSSGKLSWLAPTSNGGAEIVAYVFERPEHLSPTRTHVARVRPQTDAGRLPIPRLRRKCRDLPD